MDERSEEFANVRQLTRNWVIPGIGGAFFLAGSAMWKYGNIHESGWEPLGAMAMWIGGCVALFTLLRDAFPRERHATLTATRTSFSVNGGAPIAVEDIQEARVIPKAIRHARDIVELRIRNRRTRLRLGIMPQDAARFLSLVRAGAGERRASFGLSLAFAHRFFFAVAVFGIPRLLFVLAEGKYNGLTDLVGMAVFLMVGLVFLCAIFAMFLGVLRGRIVIGAEGFTTHWYGWRRYRSFETIKDIAQRKRGKLIDTIILSNEGKRARRLIARDAPDTDAQTGAEGRGLYATMWEAFDRWARMPTADRISAQLERGPRSAKEWLAGLDHLVRGGQASYRVASVTPETLVDVARASDASVEARVGAAAALLRIDGSTHRATVRIAAEACAEPGTRKALLDLVSAEENNAAIEAALDRVRRL